LMVVALAMAEPQGVLSGCGQPSGRTCKVKESAGS
jgi:hypothetical protein